MKLTTIIFAIVSLIFSVTSFALTIPPIPTEPIYYEPPIFQAPEEVKQMSCVQLDNSIRYLHPYTYSYKADFYADDTNKFATAMITFDVLPIVGEWLGFAYLGYSTLVGEKENRRFLKIKQQVAMLQQVKSEKHCFE